MLDIRGLASEDSTKLEEKVHSTEKKCPKLQISNIVANELLAHQTCLQTNDLLVRTLSVALRCFFESETISSWHSSGLGQN